MTFQLNATDERFYNTYIKDFIPDKIIDVHTHVWLTEFKRKKEIQPRRTVTWPSMVAKDNSIEDHMNSYRIMFPEKKVIPVIFSNLSPGDDLDAGNGYIRSCAEQYKLPSLMYATPEMKGEVLERAVNEGGFLGIKVYLDFSSPQIPKNEICIYDFLTRDHLEAADKNGWIVMLHIPRNDRLKDPLNIAQMTEIDRTYKNAKVIIAHVGRAYCFEDVGDAFEHLRKTERLYFDISANCNEQVFTELLKNIDRKRILFGSDLPILKMRTKRICENGMYINLIPKGLYGDVSGDPHMRECTGEIAEQMTLFMYEEIDAFRKATLNTGLKEGAVEDIFYNNACRMLREAGFTKDLD
jgi:predicted TIM-barrel fold metal-dependent hydrolase